MKYPEIANFLVFSVQQGLLIEDNINRWLENIVANNDQWPDWVDEIYLTSNKKQKLLHLFTIGRSCEQEVAANLILELTYKKWKEGKISFSNLEIVLLNLKNYDYFFEEYQAGYEDWISYLRSYIDDFTNPLVNGEKNEVECQKFIDNTFEKFYKDKNLLHKLNWLVY